MNVQKIITIFVILLISINITPEIYAENEEGEYPALWIDFYRNERGKIRKYTAEANDGEKVKFNIEMTLKNIGNVTAFNINVKLLDNKGKTLNDINVPNLFPNETKNITIKITIKSPREFKLTGIATTEYNGTTYSATTSEHAIVEVYMLDRANIAWCGLLWIISIIGTIVILIITIFFLRRFFKKKE